MNRSDEAGRLPAEEIISATAGAVRFSSPPRDADRQLALARGQVDIRLAELAMESILVRLDERPRDSAALLALVLLGSANPEAAEAVRISPSEEAERLAELLEGEGSSEWAAALRRVLKVGSGVRISGIPLRRASKSGRPNQPDAAVVPRGRRPWSALMAVGLALFLLMGGLWRELDLRKEWRSTPAALAGDLPSMRRRVAALGMLIEESGPWLGLPAVAAERLRLEGEVRRLARAESSRVAGERREAARRVADADEAREWALLALEAGSVHEAGQWLTYALERGGSEWDGARQVERDLATLGVEAGAGSGRTGAGGGITR